MKSLQLEIDHEREILIGQSAKQKQTFESEIHRLKDEEGKLKEKVVDYQKEIDKMENELSELSERCDDLDKQNIRQAREIDGYFNLQRKVSHYRQFVISSPFNFHLK